MKFEPPFGTMCGQECSFSQPIFIAIFRGLFLLEVRILPAAPELWEAYVFSPPPDLHFLV